MNELIEKFLDFKIHNLGRSPRTAEVYRLALTRLAGFLEETGLDWAAATHDDLVLFTGVWLHRKGLKDPFSRRPHVSAVREFYKWAKQTGQLPSSPAEYVPYPDGGRRLPDVMTMASAEKLMWAPDFSTFEGVRDGAMIAVLIGCGLRVTGLVSLNESHIITEAIEGRPRLVLKVREKGGRDRKMPVPEQVDLLLRLYMEHPTLAEIDRTLPNGDKVLFVNTRNRTVPAHEHIGENRRLRRAAVREVIQKYGKQQGIPENQLHPHAIRHLFGTELAEEDVDLLVRQKLMGHANAKTTEIYTHLALRKLTRASDLANPMAKMRTPASDLLARLKAMKP